MVTAELSYNPYNQKIEIKFNGQEPRINSMVEKHIKNPLRDWVNEIPGIFYDEMNGYGFRFDFSGTALDFEELQKAFKKQGVAGEVEFNHKNKFASREEKNKVIDELLDWLNENRNENLKYDDFRAENVELFDTDYPIKVIGDAEFSSDILREMSAEIENIDDINDLEHTNLRSIPIVFFVNESTISGLQNNIKYIMGRKDVSEEQLFLLVDNVISAQKVERTVSDLGVNNPKVIAKIDDEKVLEYLRLYPISDYIYKALCLLKDTAMGIRKPIDDKNEEYSQKNIEFKSKLEDIDNRIAVTKKAKEEIKEYSFYNATSEEWKKLQEEFEVRIRRWKEGKTLIKNDDNAADVYAKEFDRYINGIISEISKRCNEYRIKDFNLLENNIGTICENVEGINFVGAAGVIKPPTSVLYGVEIVDELKKTKVSKYVQKQEGIVDKIFNSNKSVNNELVLSTIYYFNDWRNLAVETVCPDVNKTISTMYEQIVKISDDYITKCKELLDEVYKKQIEEKENLLATLSSEEKNMQKDLEWIQYFEDMLVSIEEE